MQDCKQCFHYNEETNECEYAKLHHGRKPCIAECAQCMWYDDAKDDCCRPYVAPDEPLCDEALRTLALRIREEAAL